MAKSIKLTNEIYLDTSSIVYKKEKMSNILTYSKKEQVIGTWLDGKPIYRKVLSFNQTLTNGTTTNHNINNLDKMIDAHGWINHSQWGQTPVPLTHSYMGGMVGIGNFNSTNFTWFVGSDISAGLVDASINMILEYTKTTD